MEWTSDGADNFGNLDGILNAEAVGVTNGNSGNSTQALKKRIKNLRNELKKHRADAKANMRTLEMLAKWAEEEGLNIDHDKIAEYNEKKFNEIIEEM